jgi:hypothetical protein
MMMTTGSHRPRARTSTCTARLHMGHTSHRSPSRQRTRTRWRPSIPKTSCHAQCTERRQQRARGVSECARPPLADPAGPQPSKKRRASPTIAPPMTHARALSSLLSSRGAPACVEWWQTRRGSCACVSGGASGPSGARRCFTLHAPTLPTPPSRPCPNVAERADHQQLSDLAQKKERSSTGVGHSSREREACDCLPRAMVARLLLLLLVALAGLCVGVPASRREGVAESLAASKSR